MQGACLRSLVLLPLSLVIEGFCERCILAKTDARVWILLLVRRYPLPQLPYKTRSLIF